MITLKTVIAKIKRLPTEDQREIIPQNSIMVKGLMEKWRLPKLVIVYDASMAIFSLLPANI